MRWAAPTDTTGITLSVGPVAVNDGIAETADDLSIGDRASMAAQGFEPAPDVAPVAPVAPVKPAPAPVAPKPEAQPAPESSEQSKA